MYWRLPPKAPTGRPPPMILPKVVRSGSMPKRAWAPPKAARKPVMTSSKMSRAPYWRGDLAQAFEEAGPGQDKAHVGGHGFDDDGGDAFAMPAEDLAHGVKIVVGASRVSATTAAGTPGVPGMEKVATPEPAAARKGSAWPW